jgi:hypothetical protein
VCCKCSSAASTIRTGGCCDQQLELYWHVVDDDSNYSWYRIGIVIVGDDDDDDVIESLFYCLLVDGDNVNTEGIGGWSMLSIGMRMTKVATSAK